VSKRSGATITAAPEAPVPLRIAVLGLGLIGGSAAQVWRTVGHSVVGWSRRQSTVALAVDRGILDIGAPSATAAVDYADIVVLATPVLAMRALMGEISSALRVGAIVTDVASTKEAPERWAAELLPAHAHWIGAHPMAGKEVSGLDHVDPSLFRGRTWVVVPPPGADRKAVATVERLGRELGSRVIEMDASSHDDAVANVSHLPFMASTALSDAVIGSERFEAWSAVAATGLRDLTRLASGDALMHRDICITNRDRIADAMDRFATELASMAAQVRALPDPDEASGTTALDALGARFARVKADRDEWLPTAR
jgi:prephenate dehydrogenase